MPEIYLPTTPTTYTPTLDIKTILAVCFWPIDWFNYQRVAVRVPRNIPAPALDAVPSTPEPPF